MHPHDLLTALKAYEPELIAIRRDIHTPPRSASRKPAPPPWSRTACAPGVSTSPKASPGPASSPPSRAGAFGCSAEVTYTRRYPPLITHAEQTAVSVAAAQALVGTDKVDTDCPPFMGSEDFAFMLQACPGSFIMIGNGRGENGKVHHVHTPEYDFNDQILTLGSAYWVQLVREELRAS
jgi:metal-dependent amidase/aminoacylase/carboxypeptidase family protein